MVSSHRIPRPPRSERTDILLCALMLALITVLRMAVSNPIEAVGFLYVIPISLLASERGLRGGLLAAGGAIACTACWTMAQHVELGMLGYGTRTVTYLGVGVFVGLQSQRRLKLQREREDLLAELQATATHDQLTGLPNRRAWDDRLERELRRAAACDEPLSVLAIDLDRLKHINNTHGHAEGDRLLQRCAHAWNGALRQGDYLARLGGDEFLVLLPGSPADNGPGGRPPDPRSGALQPDLLDRLCGLGRCGARLRAGPPRRSGHVRGEGGRRRAHRRRARRRLTRSSRCRCRSGTGRRSPPDAARRSRSPSPATSVSMPLRNERTLRPVMRSTGSQNSSTVAYWKNIRVSRTRWCSPSRVRLRSAGVSVSSSTRDHRRDPPSRYAPGGTAPELLLVEPDHLA